MRRLEEGARLLGRYTLIRRLGGGPTTAIWLAHDRQADNRVALKFLDSGASEATRARFAHEWRTSARLMHPNIVRVFEYHDDDAGPFYSMQYLGDTDIGVTARAEPSAWLRPVAMVADGLRYAHGKGVVHRDVKASNVLLDSRGLPYLVDFGVAADEGSDSRGTSGTPAASSPEQRAGGAAAPADDIYALGVLMHELASGAPPADGAGPAIGESAMPASLVPLLAAMLDADPARRPNAERVVEALTSAGFPPGPAPARFVRGREAAVEVIESAAAPQRAGPVRVSAARQDAATGEGLLNPKVIYGALGAAIALLLVVVFGLPRLIGDAAEPVGAPTIAAETPAEPAQPDDAEVASEPDEPAPREVVASDAAFNENILAASGEKARTDEALGDLLSQLERLRYRAIERWGGQPYLDAVNVYAEGDQAYIDKNYRLAGEKYRQALEMLKPFFDRIDTVFDESLAAAKQAFEAGDFVEAIRLYDLSVAITPGNREAEAGLARARNLEAVLSLVEQGEDFEGDLALGAARRAFEQALELDPAWQPALDGLARIEAAILDYDFQQRMTEGFTALADGDFASARVSFEAAKKLKPGSPQPGDGLLQVDQEAKLAEIRRLEREAQSLEAEEQWESAVVVYGDILKVDPDLRFAQDGLARARQRAAIYAQLKGYIDDPDSLSRPATMQAATKLLLDLTRMDVEGPRLEDHKAELSRLLKRAATPLPVQLVSDQQTNVAIYRVGQFGTFAMRQIELRPGNYVAVGSRNGYRDVRIEFRVAPEIEMQPVVVRCEEPI